MKILLVWICQERPFLFKVQINASYFAICDAFKKNLQLKKKLKANKIVIQKNSRKKEN